MKKELYLFLSIGVLNLVLFFGIFKLLQNETIYRHSLGQISENYERTGDWNNYTIQKVAKPYTELTNENLSTWDAAIYKCINERWYKIEESCYGNVRGAFFPLFPFIWKITNSSPIGISLINYLIFIVSIALLVIYLSRVSFRNKLIIFMVLITLPTTVIYYIPYTEALFLLTMTIAVIGLLRNRYWLYFIGFLLMAIVRPATVFVLLAILFVELVIYLRKGHFMAFVKSSFLNSIPFLIGYGIAYLTQTISSGNPSTMLDAQSHWSGENPIIAGITDWSLEGFGMNSIAIFFVSIPALFFLIYLVFNIQSRKGFLFKKAEFTAEAKLFLISIAYLVGIFIFTFFTSGGNLHSYFRFTLASPLFYIAILILINYLQPIKIRNRLLTFGVLSLFLITFLSVTDYGGDRLQFSFVGMYLLLLAFLYLLTRKCFSKKMDVITLSVLVLASMVWNTYLFNMFLSDGWIFT